MKRNKLLLAAIVTLTCASFQNTRADSDGWGGFAAGSMFGLGTGVIASNAGRDRYYDPVAEEEARSIRAERRAEEREEREERKAKKRRLKEERKAKKRLKSSDSEEMTTEEIKLEIKAKELELEALRLRLKAL